MMLSKYINKIYISKNTYAVFNNFIMKPIFINKEKMIYLYNNKFDCFLPNELEILKNAGIIVKSKMIDTEIINILKNTYKSRIENKITIMYIIPINSCNLSCKYCFIGKMNDKIIKMTFETAKKAVDLFQKHLIDINEKGSIFFYGGEPLMNFNLIKKIVDYVSLNKYNIDFSMVSNGLLLNDSKAKFIKENKISLGISIDGPKKITDSNRVYKNSDFGVYDDLVKKIKLLQKNNVDFGLSITVAPIFLKNKKEFINWLKELNVKNISYNLLHFTYETEEWRKYYNDAVNFIYYSNNELFEFGFNEDRINRKYKSFYNREFKFSDCGAVGANQLTICPDGNLEVCHGYWNSKNKEIGNINDFNSFDELFINKHFCEWKKYLPIFKNKCLKCSAIYICGGGCAMQSKDLFGDSLKIDKAFCIYSKKMLKNILIEEYQKIIKNN